MELLFVLIVVLYCLPIVVLLCTPNSYLGLTIALLLFLSPLIFLRLLVFPDLEFLEFFFSEGLLWLSVTSYVPALLLKLHAIRLKRKGEAKKARRRLLLAFIGPVIFFATWPSVSKFLSAPPSEQCIKSTLKAHISNYELTLAPLVMFDINTSIYKQETNYKALCKKTENGAKPLDVHTIDLAFRKSMLRRKPYNVACLNAAPEWQKAACAFDKSAKKDYPMRMRIFEKGTTHGQRVPGMVVMQYDSTHDEYEMTIANKTSQPTQAIGDGILVVSDVPKGNRTFWRANHWHTPDGKLYTVRCGDFTNTNKASCETMYGLNDRLTIRYEFSANLAELPAVAAVVDRNVMEIIRDMRVSSTR